MRKAYRGFGGTTRRRMTCDRVSPSRSRVWIQGYDHGAYAAAWHCIVSSAYAWKRYAGVIDRPHFHVRLVLRPHDSSGAGHGFTSSISVGCCSGKHTGPGHTYFLGWEFLYGCEVSRHVWFVGRRTFVPLLEGKAYPASDRMY